MIVFDCETVRPILKKNEKPKDQYEYAESWTDYKGMGISVVCFYNYQTGCIFDLLEDHIKEKSDEFLYAQNLIKENELIAGFNIKKFDNNLIREFGINIPDIKTYDILELFWLAIGLDPKNFNPRTHGGYNLEKFLKINFPDGDIQKTMNGVNAPYMWQDGKKDEVVEYCRNDVKVEKALFNKIFETGGLINPKTKKFVKMPLPRAFN